MKESIRRVIAEQANLPVDVASLGDDDDLYAAGLTSHAVVNVMLALEDELDVELPEALLRKSTFRSVASLNEAFAGLVEAGAAP